MAIFARKPQNYVAGNALGYDRTTGRLIDLNGAPGTASVQTFTRATRAATAPSSASAIGVETDTLILYRATGTGAGNWQRMLPIVVALNVSGGSVATDASRGDTFQVNLTGDATLATPTNGTDGQRVLWRIKQANSGGHSLSLDSGFRVPSGVDTTIDSTNAKTTILGAVYNATDAKWDVISSTVQMG